MYLVKQINDGKGTTITGYGKKLVFFILCYDLFLYRYLKYSFFFTKKIFYLDLFILDQKFLSIKGLQGVLVVFHISFYSDRTRTPCVSVKYTEKKSDSNFILSIIINKYICFVCAIISQFSMGSTALREFFSIITPLT